jgi:hypothetical protein
MRQEVAVGNVVRPQGKSKADKMSGSGYLRAGASKPRKIVGRKASRKKMP